MLYWKICHVYTWFELLFDVVDVVDDVVATTRRQRLTQLIILNTQIQTNQRQCQCQQQRIIAKPAVHCVRQQNGKRKLFRSRRKLWI